MKLPLALLSLCGGDRQNQQVSMTQPTEKSAPELLQLRAVSRRRAGRLVLRELDLSLARGQVLGLLGVNGAGKSTTLAMLAGALVPDSGQILVDGQDFAEYPQLARRHIGWLPERAPLWPELTVAEHLDVSGRWRGLRGAALRDAREATLQSLQLEPLRKRLAGVLSQGQRQRLGLACALVHAPPLLVLDEPANGLDPVQIKLLRSLIRARADAGCGVIVSTHLLSEVTAVCDRVAILHQGVLRYEGQVHGGDDSALEKRFFDIAMADTTTTEPAP